MNGIFYGFAHKLYCNILNFHFDQKFFGLTIEVFIKI